METYYLSCDGDQHFSSHHQIQNHCKAWPCKPDEYQNQKNCIKDTRKVGVTKM